MKNSLPTGFSSFSRTETRDFSKFSKKAAGFLKFRFFTAPTPNGMQEKISLQHHQKFSLFSLNQTVFTFYCFIVNINLKSC
jgi:hypothetical protein